MNLHIESLQAAQNDELRRVLTQAHIELFAWKITVDALLSDADFRATLRDIDDALAHYVKNGGIFRVLMDGDEIVGMGAVRRLDANTCELKRMWFLQAVRGRGWGRKMAQELIDWARENGFAAMRLDSGPAPTFTPAHRLYQSLGFVEIERYNDNVQATIWMELRL